MIAWTVVALLVIIFSLQVDLGRSFAFTSPSNRGSSVQPLYSAAGLDSESKNVLRVYGMKCGGCRNKIQGVLSKFDPSVIVTLDPPEAHVSRDIDLNLINIKLRETGEYSAEFIPSSIPSIPTQTRSAKTYLPLIASISSVIVGTLIAQRGAGRFNVEKGMRHFMSGYFLLFSLFKLTNLKGFVRVFSTYDLLAAKSREYAHAYPFIELALAYLYLINFSPGLLNLFTLVLMTVSSIGVITAVLANKQLECACMGTYFNLPMTFVTIVEDVGMALMALLCLIWNIKK